MTPFHPSSKKNPPGFYDDQIPPPPRLGVHHLASGGGGERNFPKFPFSMSLMENLLKGGWTLDSQTFFFGGGRGGVLVVGFGGSKFGRLSDLGLD